MAQDVSLKDIRPALGATARRISELEDPVVVCHIDADGISSGAVIAHALKKMEKPFEVLPVKQLDPSTYETIPWERDLIFVDFGSGQIEKTKDYVIIDHHQPIKKTKYQLNAHYLGLNGSRDISASMLCYLVSREMIGDNKMAEAAVVGMVGDQMTRKPLHGVARLPVKTKWVSAVKGLTFFGRETRPLSVFLKYMSEPFMPGLSGDAGGSYKFLKKLSLEPNDTYHSLSDKQKNNFHSELIKYGAKRGAKVHRMLGEYYILPKRPGTTEMRDTSEFSTLLNACGRHERPEIGIGIMLGDNVYDEAKKLLRIHRMLLARGMEELEGRGVSQFRNFQLFESESIKPTIIGIVAGIAISSRLVSPLKPIIAIVPTEGGYKVSGRATLSLTDKGINLGKAMQVASGKEEGGGGHDIAAGAFVEETGLKNFLLKMDKVLGEQLK
ncbi:MAG: DHH family phosphoesterase [Candidatus Altiarchaeota archaeon]|nr:DHH family phosphoesterase [Candidatus Altiarchaeota archaeon]